MSYRTALFSLALVAAMASAPAQAVTYDFSFNGTIGPVNGQIDLAFIINPGETGTGAASHVLITSYPAIIGALPEGSDAVLWSIVGGNTFTVTGGVITAFTFAASTGTGSPDDIVLCLNGAGQLLGSDRYCNFNLNYLGGGIEFYTSNFDGAPGVTFQASAVPEPATWGLMILGFAGLALARRRKVSA